MMNVSVSVHWVPAQRIEIISIEVEAESDQRRRVAALGRYSIKSGFSWNITRNPFGAMTGKIAFACHKFNFGKM